MSKNLKISKNLKKSQKIVFFQTIFFFDFFLFLPKKKCYPLSFPILGGSDLTRALQSSPFQISGGGGYPERDGGGRRRRRRRKSSCLILDSIVQYIFLSYTYSVHIFSQFAANVVQRNTSLLHNTAALKVQCSDRSPVQCNAVQCSTVWG